MGTHSREQGPRANPLADRLHSLAIHLLRRVRSVDAAAGLSAARLSALSVLVYGGPRGVSELATAEQVTAATMSRLITALEGDGLVGRSADPSDARRVRVAATAAGVRALEAARGKRVVEVAAVLEGLGVEDEAVVESAVTILERALSDAAGGGGAR